MIEKIRETLKGINQGIENYNGNNLFEDLGIDSHDIFNVVVSLEEAFDIEIPPIYMRMENFESLDKIEAMIQEIMHG